MQQMQVGVTKSCVVYACSRVNCSYHRTKVALLAGVSHHISCIAIAYVIIPDVALHACSLWSMRPCAAIKWAQLSS